QTSNCGSTVAPGEACAISVTMTPSAAGSRSGTLSVTDKAGASQAVSLSGTGADFFLSASSTSASVTAGQSAAYTVSVIPAGGFNQIVLLTCSGAPQTATCSISPASVTLNGSSASTVSVTVTTVAASAVPPPQWPQHRPPRGTLPAPPAGWARHGVPWLLVCLLTMAMFARLAAWRRRRVAPLPMRVGIRAAILCLPLMLAIMMSACGGGGGGGGPSNPGTPTGTYSITVSATFTSGSTTLKHNLTLSLKVE